jgi:hypothetical protein
MVWGGGGVRKGQGTERLAGWGLGLGEGGLRHAPTSSCHAGSTAPSFGLAMADVTAISPMAGDVFMAAAMPSAVTVGDRTL